MRLDVKTQSVIRNTTREVFGDQATVRVFGSRTDARARGGDIDLLVTTPQQVPDARRKTLTLIARLQRRLGDQPIDVLYLDPQSPPTAVQQEALRHGIAL